MTKSKISRREAFSGILLGSAGVCLPLQACSRSEKEDTSSTKTKFRFCLNTSTISGKNPGLKEYIRLASEAGYDGIEVWVRDVQACLEQGDTIQDIRTFIEDYGIRVENAIGFAPWMTGGKEGFLQMKEEMNMLSGIGCRRIAAPPAGVAADRPLDLFATGEKYRELLELGRSTGVMPQLEFWGSSDVLWHLGQVLMIAAVANDPDTRILPDVYHLFRGGSGFAGLNMLGERAIEIFHMNDYPGDRPREEQNDADRVYPGDGAAPMKDIISSLSSMGGEIVLSLELFNRKYWEQAPSEVARTGLEKMKALL